MLTFKRFWAAIAPVYQTATEKSTKKESSSIHMDPTTRGMVKFFKNAVSTPLNVYPIVGTCELFALHFLYC